MSGGVSKWVQALEGKDVAKVCAAAKALGAARDQQAVEPLLKLLERAPVRIDLDEMRIKAAAVEALYAISDPASVARLGPYISLRSSWLLGEGMRIPALVAKTLGEIGSKRAIRVLVGKATASDWHYGGKETIAALKRCDREFAIELLLEHFSQSQEPRVRQQLLEVLRALRWKSNDPHLRAEIAVEMGNYPEALAEGAAAFGPLIQVVLAAPRSVAELNKIGTVRWKQCVEALVELGDKRAVPHFIDLIKLENPPFDLQADCVHALTELSSTLAKSGDRSVLGDLRETLRTHARDEIAVPIIDELEASGDAEAVDVLIERVSGRVEKTVRRAAVALGRLGDAKAIVPILRARGVINDNKLLWNVLEPFAQACYLDSWLAALQEPQEDVRRGAANVLAMIKDPRSLDALMSALGQAVNEFYSAESLEKLIVYYGKPKEVLSLSYTFGGFEKLPYDFQSTRKGMESYFGLCVSLATALGELGDARAAPALLALLQTDPARIPWPTESNGRLLLEGAEPRIQWAAAQALVKLRQPDVKEWLFRHLQYEIEPGGRIFSKLDVARELAALGDERGNEYLVAQLNGPTRMQAAQYLAQAGDRRGNDWLAIQLEGSMAIPAAQALADVDDVRGPEWLAAQLSNDSKEALPAAIALGKLGDRRGVLVLLLALYENWRSADGQFAAITDALIALQESRGVERLLEFLYYKNRARDHGKVVDALKKMLAAFGSSMDLTVLRRLAAIPAKATVIGQKAIYDDDAFANFPGSFAEKETVEPTYVDVDTEFDQTSLRDLAAAEYARRTKPPPAPVALPEALPIAMPAAAPKPDQATVEKDANGQDMYDRQLAKDPERAFGDAVVLAKRGDRRGVPVLLTILNMSARRDPQRFEDAIEALTALEEQAAVKSLIDWLGKKLRRQSQCIAVAGLEKLLAAIGPAMDLDLLKRLAAIPATATVIGRQAVYDSDASANFPGSFAEKENVAPAYHKDVEEDFDQSRLRDLARAALARRTAPPPLPKPLPVAEPIAPLPVAIPIATPAAPLNADDEEIIVAAAAPGHSSPVAMLEEAIIVEEEIVAAVPVPTPLPEPPYAVSIQAGKFRVICRCGSRYPVPFEFAGKRTKCKKCGQPIVIPATTGQ